MIKEILALIDALEAEYEAMDEESQMASAELPLKGISASKLHRIEKRLEQEGIRYWLAEPFRFNPQRQYKLWVSKTRGDSPVWGICPVTD